MSARSVIMTGSILCMLVVILGAFGAHSLKPLLSERMLDVYQTGILYQMFHAAGILAVGILSSVNVNCVTKYLKFSYRFFLLGIILFCGSLYALAFSEAITGERIAQLGIITPFGGFSFIAGWFSMFLAFWKRT